MDNADVKEIIIIEVTLRRQTDIGILDTVSKILQGTINVGSLFLLKLSKSVNRQIENPVGGFTESMMILILPE